MRDYCFSMLQTTDLTIDQRIVLMECGAVAVEGISGSGISASLLFRFISLTAMGKKCVFLTYRRSLVDYLKRYLLASGYVLAANNVHTILKWSANMHFCDEIIVDDAQEASIDIFKRLKPYAKRISYGIDLLGILYPYGTNSTELRSLFKDNKQFQLNKNLRTPKEILQIANELNSILSDNLSLVTLNTNKVDMYITQDNSIRNATIKKIVSSFIDEHQYNIALLCPCNSNVEYYRNLLQNDFPELSYYGVDIEHSLEEGMKQLHITTFKSAKGLEFDTVIIPDFHRAFEKIDPKFNVSWRDYYVGLTRARKSVILLSNNPIAQIEQYVNLKDIINLHELF